jgi:hypothetical protein
MLHCSSHLTAPLRHTQLYMSGTPTIEAPITNSVRLQTGTMWHSFFETEVLKSVPKMAETDLTPYLPEGWTGRADYLIWDVDSGCFELVDLKTIKAEGMAWIANGPKEDHIWQVSAYLMGCIRMGIPVRTDKAYVYYLPMNEIPGKRIDPVLTSFTPLSEVMIAERMDDVSRWVKQYLDGDKLADIPKPEARVFKDSKLKRFDVKLVPHWSSMYCPYGDACGCSEQRPSKLGHWTDGDTFVYSRGVDESIIPPKVPGYRWDEFNEKERV